MTVPSAADCDKVLSVVYADDTLLVLNKPSGLLSVPGLGADKQDCLSAQVQARYPDACIVHRLDMATSGLLLMARGPIAQRRLNAAFASRMVHKRYEAVVQGVAQTPSGFEATDWQDINLPIFLDWPQRPKRIIETERGQPSQTRWRVLSTDSHTQTSRLMLEPITGRSHQLRVHLAAVGLPILGDAFYAPVAVAAQSARLLLHATELSLSHPVSSETLHLQSPAPF
jgi:tRNA pseudouridine32 synthase/23S rRNA pseudouridine746 synthase